MTANLDDVCIRYAIPLPLLSPPSVFISLLPSKVRDNGTVFLCSGSEWAEKKVTMATAPVLFSRPSVAWAGASRGGASGAARDAGFGDRHMSLSTSSGFLIWSAWLRLPARQIRRQLCRHRLLRCSVRNCWSHWQGNYWSRAMTYAAWAEDCNNKSRGSVGLGWGFLTYSCDLFPASSLYLISRLL